MITLEDVIGVLDHPDELENITIEELREFLKKYPYFEAAQKLLNRKLMDSLGANHPLVRNRALTFGQAPAITFSPKANGHTNGNGNGHAHGHAHTIQASEPDHREEAQSYGEMAVQDPPRHQPPSEPAMAAPPSEDVAVPPEEPAPLTAADDILMQLAERKRIASEPESWDTKEAAEANPEPTTPTQEAPKQEGEKDSFAAWLHKFEAPKGQIPIDPSAGAAEVASERISAELPDFEQLPGAGQAGEGTLLSPEEQANKSSLPPQQATETLANIYVTQGKIQAAIEVFEQLQLKFPAKSGIFADRIRELRNQL